MNNRTKLINDIVSVAQEKCRKNGIVASQEILENAVIKTLGHNLVGDNEFIITKTIDVSEEVAINANGALCRTITVDFSTREFRIATNNYMLFVSTYYSNKNSNSQVGGYIHPYTGSAANLPDETFKVGDSSKFDNKNVYAFYYGQESRMVSFETQDVFVIIKNYRNFKLASQMLDIPHNHSDGGGKDYYIGNSNKYPNWHSNFDSYWYYNSTPIKGWFGRIKGHERYGEPVGALVKLRKGKREGYCYGIDCKITDDVASYLLEHSWSFNPRTLERLPTC